MQNHRGACSELDMMVCPREVTSDLEEILNENRTVRNFRGARVNRAIP